VGSRDIDASVVCASFGAFVAVAFIVNRLGVQMPIGATTFWSISHQWGQSSAHNLTFDVADLTDRLPKPDASVDITPGLYSALQA